MAGWDWDGTREMGAQKKPTRNVGNLTSHQGGIHSFVSRVKAIFVYMYIYKHLAGSAMEVDSQKLSRPFLPAHVKETR